MTVADNMHWASRRSGICRRLYQPHRCAIIEPVPSQFPSASSVSPKKAETLYLLGADDRVVGVSGYTARRRRRAETKVPRL